jgi:hypothetical protein
MRVTRMRVSKRWKKQARKIRGKIFAAPLRKGLWVKNRLNRSLTTIGQHGRGLKGSRVMETWGVR